MEADDFSIIRRSIERSIEKRKSLVREVPLDPIDLQVLNSFVFSHLTLAKDFERESEYIWRSVQLLVEKCCGLKQAHFRGFSWAGVNAQVPEGCGLLNNDFRSMLSFCMITSYVQENMGLPPCILMSAKYYSVIDKDGIASEQRSMGEQFVSDILRTIDMNPKADQVPRFEKQTCTFFPFGLVIKSIFILKELPKLPAKYKMSYKRKAGELTGELPTTDEQTGLVKKPCYIPEDEWAVMLEDEIYRKGLVKEFITGNFRVECQVYRSNYRAYIWDMHMACIYYPGEELQSFWYHLSKFIEYCALLCELRYDAFSWSASSDPEEAKPEGFGILTHYCRVMLSLCLILPRELQNGQFTAAHFERAKYVTQNMGMAACALVSPGSYCFIAKDGKRSDLKDMGLNFVDDVLNYVELEPPVKQVPNFVQGKSTYFFYS